MGTTSSTQPPPSLLNKTALGGASEHLVVAKLLERGCRVALPVVDDDGVDLVVNYRTTVQVKTSLEAVVATSELRKHQFHVFKHPRPWITKADVFVFHGRAGCELEETWWIVPRWFLVDRGIKSGLSLNRGSKGRSADFSQWIEAWHVFDS